jgi:hypothetical protein
LQLTIMMARPKRHPIVQSTESLRRMRFAPASYTIWCCWHANVLFVGVETVSLNIELPAQEIAALKQVTKLDNAADAVVRAAREFLRLQRLRELKAVSGKADSEDNWQELENLELAESDFPS